MNSNGMSAISVVAAPTTSGPTTARAPAIAAPSAVPPRLLSVAMLSPTTTASSTTMPTIRKNANRVPIFSVRSAGAKKISDPTKVSGMPNVVQKATRRSNTATRQMNTRTAPITAFPRISVNRSIMSSALSSQTSTETCPGGL